MTASLIKRFRGKAWEKYAPLIIKEMNIRVLESQDPAPPGTAEKRK